MMDKKGFTLVELSIVLVVVGLLIGGILVGQSLIDTVKNRKLVEEISFYKYSAFIFKDKFRKPPGDFDKATQMLSSTCACDGDGDGILENNNERFYIWEQLSLSGIIEGNYLGYQTAADSFIGSSVPTSSYGNNIGYEVYNYSIATLGWAGADSIARAYMRLGGLYTADPPVRIGSASFTSTTAQYVDSKIDDGLSGQGSIYAQLNANGACVTSANYLTATYRVNTSGNICYLNITLNDDFYSR